MDSCLKASPYVAVDLQELDKQIGDTISAAWASNTISTRSSQWRIYMDFCRDNGLQAVPAGVLTIARFLLYKSQTSKYGTINNYLSSIISLHKYYGFEAEYRSTYFMKLLLEGLRHKLGDTVQQAESLTPSQLCKMSKFVDFRMANK